jgi:hypothetical protein
MKRRLPFAGVIAIGLVLGLMGSALAAVTWGAQSAIPGAYTWNYSNSMDFHGTPGAAGFRLDEAFISDNTLPEAVYYTRKSATGAWSAPVKVSGDKNADGSSLASAGKTIITGWQTGYTYYDADGTARNLQISVSQDGGSTWGNVKNLTSTTGFIDYPIVAASKTTYGPINLYAAWVNSTNGKVQFREKSGSGKWSPTVTLGTTTHTDASGYLGYANIAATGNLITVAWIADDTGQLKARAINLSSATAAATLSNWPAAVSLTGKISITQNGFPIVSASSLVPGLTTIAWNTDTAQVVSTYNGSTIDTTPATVFTDGSAGGVTYTGGYSLAVEPAPGGFIGIWAGCVDTNLSNDCDYGAKAARFNLLSSTSTDGQTWSTTPTLVAGSTVTHQPLNDEASIVALSGGTVYAQYNGYDAAYNNYDTFLRVGTGSYAP